MKINKLPTGDKMTIETIKEILGWLDQHSWYIISIFIPIGLFCIFYGSKQIEKANKELIENLKKLLNDEEFNFLIDDKNRTKYLRKFNDIIETEMSITEDKYIAILADFRDTIKVDFQEKLRLDEIRKQIL